MTRATPPQRTMSIRPQQPAANIKAQPRRKLASTAAKEGTTSLHPTARAALATATLRIRTLCAPWGGGSQGLGAEDRLLAVLALAHADRRTSHGHDAHS